MCVHVFESKDAMFSYCLLCLELIVNAYLCMILCICDGHEDAARCISKYGCDVCLAWFQLNICVLVRLIQTDTRATYEFFLRNRMLFILWCGFFEQSLVWFSTYGRRLRWILSTIIVGCINFGKFFMLISGGLTWLLLPDVRWRIKITMYRKYTFKYKN